MGIGLGQANGVQIEGQQAGFGGGPAAGIAVGVRQVLVQIVGTGQIQAALVDGQAEFLPVFHDGLDDHAGGSAEAIVHTLSFAGYLYQFIEKEFHFQLKYPSNFS